MFVPQKIPRNSRQSLRRGSATGSPGLLEGEGGYLAGPPSAPRSPAVQVAMGEQGSSSGQERLLGVVK